jgi:S-adenosylmethionine synthetase
MFYLKTLKTRFSHRSHGWATDRLPFSGELTTNAIIDIEKNKHVRTCHDCGYHDEIAIAIFLSHNKVMKSVSGVDNDGAGDQGIMVGYANK